MKRLLLGLVLCTACAIGTAGPNGVHGIAFGHGSLIYCDPSVEAHTKDEAQGCSKIEGGLPTSSADIRIIAIEALSVIATIAGSIAAAGLF